MGRDFGCLLQLVPADRPTPGRSAALPVREAAHEGEKSRSGKSQQQYPKSAISTDPNLARLRQTIRLQTESSTSFVQLSLPEISGYATNKNDCGALETEKTITSL